MQAFLVSSLLLGSVDVLAAPTCTGPVTRISQIQGSAHTSPLNGQPVVTEGIVNRVEASRIYIQVCSTCFHCLHVLGPANVK
jgi:hypothetical protein